MKPSFDKYKLQERKNKISDTIKKKKESSKGVSNPIDEPNDDSQIISGYFLQELPYKELIIARFNNFLYCVLGLLVLFCLVCYYFVSCKEVQLNQISRETLELNYENEELQNKVDSLQSYYNVDKAVSKSNILERAKQVVEVDAATLPHVNLNKSNKTKKTLVINY